MRGLGVKDTELEIFHGDTLLNDWEILCELNPAKKPTFDAIDANPPISSTPPASPSASSCSRSARNPTTSSSSTPPRIWKK